MFRNAVCLLVLALIVSVPLQAQNTPVDYQIALAGVATFSPDQTAINVTLQISNKGGGATESTKVQLLDQQGKGVALADLPPLASGEQKLVTLTFPAGLFDPGSHQKLQVAINSTITTVKSADIEIDIPGTPPTLAQPTAESPNVIVVPGLNIRIDTSNSQQLAIAAGVGLAALLLLLLVIVIFRLLFQRPPSFGAWQPPYAVMPPMNPDTLGGRRQLWQQHAQNGAMPGFCSEGGLHARKMLLGMDNRNLSSWRITALRISQYDMYGRVSRSQVLAPGGLVRRLDRLARKNQSLNADKLTKQMRPVASGLVKAFSKKINKRNAMLAIALDVRFQGVHGEVRIIFEVYQCQRGQWQQIDWWEPDMTIVGKTIHDSYTYTLYGQMGGETLKEFRRRLQDDLVRVLVDMVGVRPPGTPQPDTLPSIPPVQLEG